MLCVGVEWRRGVRDQVMYACEKVRLLYHCTDLLYHRQLALVDGNILPRFIFFSSSSLS